MASLDDVVAGLELNAELNQNIHSLQKAEILLQRDTNNNIQEFVQILKNEQLDRQERTRENSRSSSEAPSKSFRGALGESAGTGIGGGLGLAAKGIGAGVGLAGLGFGIGGFFAGLAAGSAGVDIFNTDMVGLKTLVMNLDDVFQEMSGKGMIAIGGLLAAGGAFGALFGPGASMKAGFGMFAIGAGIGGFFAGLAAGSAGVDIFATDGANLATLMKNLAEGMGAFASRDLTGLTALLAAGALFGQAPAAAGKAAIGMGLIGAGIGAFFLGIAGIGKVAELIGADGSGIKTIMTNLSEGLTALSSDAIDTEKLLSFGLVGASVAAGMAALTASGMIKGLTSFVGSFFKDDGPTVFERIAQDLKVLSEVPLPKLEGFGEMSKSIFNLGMGLDKIAGIDMDDFRDNIKEFNSMVEDGTINLSTPLLANTVAERTMSNIGEQQGVTIINNNTNAPTTTQNNVSTSVGDMPLPSATNNNQTRSDAYA